jgi:hypothetical protein
VSLWPSCWLSRRPPDSRDHPRAKHGHEKLCDDNHHRGSFANECRRRAEYVRTYIVCLPFSVRLRRLVGRRAANARHTHTNVRGDLLFCYITTYYRRGSSALVDRWMVQDGWAHTHTPCHRQLLVSPMCHAPNPSTSCLAHSSCSSCLGSSTGSCVSMNVPQWMGSPWRALTARYLKKKKPT